MKKLSTFLSINEEEKESSSVSSVAIDFEKFLDSINDKIEEIQEIIEDFKQKAGNVPDNDLDNKQMAIKTYIDAITTKFDELEEDKEAINKDNSVSIL